MNFGEIKRFIAELLLPTPKKMLVIFILSVILLTVDFSDGVWSYQGFPIPFLKWSGPNNINRDNAIGMWYFLIPDFIIWYILGSVLAWILTILFYVFIR